MWLTTIRYIQATERDTCVSRQTVHAFSTEREIYIYIYTSTLHLPLARFFRAFPSFLPHGTPGIERIIDWHASARNFFAFSSFRIGVSFTIQEGEGVRVGRGFSGGSPWSPFIFDGVKFQHLLDLILYYGCRFVRKYIYKDSGKLEHLFRFWTLEIGVSFTIERIGGPFYFELSNSKYFLDLEEESLLCFEYCEISVSLDMIY